jgi:hypothetical protein
MSHSYLALDQILINFAFCTAAGFHEYSKKLLEIEKKKNQERMRTYEKATED